MANYNSIAIREKIYSDLEDGVRQMVIGKTMFQYCVANKKIVHQDELFKKYFHKMLLELDPIITVTIYERNHYTDWDLLDVSVERRILTILLKPKNHE